MEALEFQLCTIPGIQRCRCYAQPGHRLIPELGNIDSLQFVEFRTLRLDRRIGRATVPFHRNAQTPGKALRSQSLRSCSKSAGWLAKDASQLLREGGGGLWAQGGLRTTPALGAIIHRELRADYSRIAYAPATRNAASKCTSGQRSICDDL